MKRILAVVLVTILAFLATGCETQEEVRARGETHRVQNLQANADRVVRNIQYMKDTRTGLCFAYYWNGGPSLVTVPCEAVPPHMLTVAK